jgi:NTP pyrophosphatase (non-canonical NTP hydrolase)
MISIEELQSQVHKTALEHGWWPLIVTSKNIIDFEQVNIPEKLMLMVSELGEALEFYRDDVGMLGPVYWLSESNEWVNDKEKEINKTIEALASTKPDGFWVEIADVIIRILDLAGAYDIDMEELVKLKHAYNKTRPYRHGGKKC